LYLEGQLDSKLCEKSEKNTPVNSQKTWLFLSSAIVSTFTQTFEKALTESVSTENTADFRRIVTPMESRCTKVF